VAIEVNKSGKERELHKKVDLSLSPTW